MSNLDFRLRLDAEISPLQQKLAQAQAEAMRLKQAWENNRSNEHAKMAYVQQMGEVTRIQRQLGIQANETGSQVSRLNQALTQTRPPFRMNEITQSLGRVGMAAAGAVGGLAALQKGLSDVLAATQEYQAIATRFTYAFDGAEEGAKQLEFVREEANRLGLEMMGAANGYAQFAAAAKDLNISTEQTQSVFKGVAAATAAMGLSADDANGVFLALSQIAGKGKVSMEELRGQLGERLAPAMSIAAQSMGVTTAELEKMVENGLAAETFLPRFGAALEQAFAKDAAENAKSLSGQINLLKNSYNEFLVSLGEGGVGKGVVAVLQDIGKALETAKAQFDAFSKSENGKLLEQSFSQFYDLVKEIGSTVVQVFQAAKDNIGDFASALGSAISGSKNEIDLLQAVLNGVNLTVAAMRDGVAAVGIAFDLFSGAVKDLLGFMADGMSKLTWGEWSESLKQMAADLRQEAEKNYESANQAALNFESQTAKTLQNMAEQAQQASQVTDQATQSIKQSADETVQAAAKTDDLSQAYKDAQTAVSGFGLDMRAAMGQATPAMAEAQSNLAKLAAGFDDLQAQGVDASLLLNQALEKMTDTAKNQADIDLLKQAIRTLGDTGKISFQDVERAILAADQRLQELKGTIDPTEAAFKKLGIQSRESLRLAAEETRLAFETVKNSGQASAADLQAAFERTAQALLATGDSHQRAWVESQAAAFNYKIVVDETGKANIQAAAKTVEAAKTQVAAHNEVAQAAAKAAQASQSASNATTSGSNKATNAIKQQTTQVMRLSEEMYTMFKMRPMSIQDWIKKLGDANRLYKDVRHAIGDVNAALEDGENLAKKLAKAESLASRYAEILGSQTLSKLRKAIEDARQKMAQLAEEAANARAESEKELLSAQGRDEEVARREQQQKVDALRKKQTIAQRMGNAKAASDFDAAINASNQAFAERQRREAQEREQARIEQQERERERIEQQRQRELEKQERERERAEQQRQRELEKQERERERAEQQRQRDLERQQRASRQSLQNISKQTVDVHIDDNEVFDLVNEIKSKSANAAVQKLFSQLKYAVSQTR